MKDSRTYFNIEKVKKIEIKKNNLSLVTFKTTRKNIIKTKIFFHTNLGKKHVGRFVNFAIIQNKFPRENSRQTIKLRDFGNLVIKSYPSIKKIKKTYPPIIEGCIK